MIVAAVTVVHWVAAVPLIHMLSLSIDDWADSVQGDAEQLR